MKRTKRRRMRDGVQMYEESWYLDKFDQHECCDCGLVHDVKYDVDKGRIFTRWKVNRRETTKVRKRHGIIVLRKDS